MKEIKQFDLTVKDLEKDNMLEHGILIPESDYGLAEIYLTPLGYEIFEIPMYGGEPMNYNEIIKTPEEVVEIIQSWT